MIDNQSYIPYRSRESSQYLRAGQSSSFHDLRYSTLMWQAMNLLLVGLKASGLYQYVPDLTNPGGVKLEEGEEVELIGPDNHGWSRVRKEDSRKGIVPTSVLSIFI